VVEKIFADIVLMIHFAFIVFALFGGFLVIYRKWAAWVHLPAVLWSALVNLASWICPLTPLENWFRAKAGQAGYPGGFIDHYIAPLIYPDGMPRNLQLTAAMSVLSWNVVVYLIVLHRRKTKGK
jgi:hypothetical protein